MSEAAAMASLETSEPSLSALRVPTHRGRRVAFAPVVLILVAGGAFAVERSELWNSFLAVGSRAGDVFSAPRTPSASPPVPAPAPLASTPLPTPPAGVQLVAPP